MKTYLLILKTELSDKRMLIFTACITCMIISCILGYFGTIYGRQYLAFHETNQTISGVVINQDESFFDTLLSYDEGFQYTLVSPIIEEAYQEYQYVYMSESFDTNGDLQGSYDASADDSIVIPYALSVKEDIEIGDQFTLGSSKYTVTGTIGLVLDNKSFIVSKNVFLKQANTITLEAIVDKDTSQETYASIISQLSSYLEEDFYYSAFERDYDDYINQFRMYAIVLFLAAIINVLYIYSYTMSKRKKRLVAYRLVGASNQWLSTSIVIDQLGVFSICYVVAVLATNVCFQAWILPNVANTAFMLSIEDIIRFYFIMLAVYFLMILLYLRRVKHSSISEWNHREGY